jgi:hypothetical protein
MNEKIKRLHDYVCQRLGVQVDWSPHEIVDYVIATIDAQESKLSSLKAEVRSLKAAKQPETAKQPQTRETAKQSQQPQTRRVTSAQETGTKAKEESKEEGAKGRT